MGTQNEKIDPLQTQPPADELGQAKIDPLAPHYRAPKIITHEVQMPELLWLALEELTERLQGTYPDIRISDLIERAVKSELRRREITWWETRLEQRIRTITVGEGTGEGEVVVDY
ncbi:MAG TPA: hypothetical protein VFK94_02290 [Patescibacteria group bacterium]|nr:hypothetical protein [Patescibacteria group bacterium]